MDRVSTMLSFVKVVDTGGFSSAARQLSVAASVVTTHVKQLEARLGVRLLNRTTRSISLTEAGQAYYERCVQILSEIEDAEEAAQTLQTRPRGVLRLNTSPGIPVLLAPSIAEYSKLYPEVTIRLTATSSMLDLVEQGFDLAVWYAAIPDPGLIIRRLAQYRMAVCASPEYFASHGRPRHPSELTAHNWLIFYDATHSKDGKEWVFTGPEGDFPVRMSGNLETNSPIAFRHACLYGQGILIAPTPFLINDLKSGALVSILDEFLQKQFSIDVLYPHREHVPAKVRTFIDLLAKNFRQIDWEPGTREGKRSSDLAMKSASSSDPVIAPKESTPR
jgi:DNA-binding transcriptional LysR family regulator